MAVLLPEGKQSFSTAAGLPLVGGRVYTYAAGTSTPKATYSNAAGTTANTNPVILDARGEATIFWSGAYKVTLKDASDNVIWTVDNVSDSSGTLGLDLAGTAANQGAGLVGFAWASNYAVNTLGWAVRSSSGLTNALRYVPPAEWAAILDGTSTTNLTSYIQAGLDAESSLFFPRGRWTVSATTGLVYGDGAQIKGAGLNQTIFWATLGTGGTAAQLVAYSAGAVFHRGFSPGVANDYVSGCVFEDFGIVLNHPTASVTTSAIQIGLDLRNASRTNVTRVHVGNYAPPGSFVAKADPPSGYAQQGYGIVIGNVTTGDPGYCGGEVHNICESLVWGAYKLIVQDDATLSPLSSAHAVIVQNCDLQGGHHGLVQESQYATGCRWEGNTIQNAIKQAGDSSDAYIERFSGYGSTRRGGYLEVGSTLCHILKLESASQSNDFELDYFSARALSTITDAGTRNRLSYNANSGAISGGVDSLGRRIELYNKAPRKVLWKGYWNGSSFTESYDTGISMTRNTTGDYTMTLDIAQPNANWIPTILIDTNVGAMVSVQYGTQSASALRFFTYSQNAGSTSSVDPAMIYISVTQAE